MSKLAFLYAHGLIIGANPPALTSAEEALRAVYDSSFWHATQGFSISNPSTWSSTLGNPQPSDSGGSPASSSPSTGADPTAVLLDVTRAYRLFAAAPNPPRTFAHFSRGPLRLITSAFESAGYTLVTRSPHVRGSTAAPPTDVDAVPSSTATYRYDPELCASRRSTAACRRKERTAAAKPSPPTIALGPAKYPRTDAVLLPAPAVPLQPHNVAALLAPTVQMHVGDVVHPGGAALSGHSAHGPAPHPHAMYAPVSAFGPVSASMPVSTYGESGVDAAAVYGGAVRRGGVVAHFGGAQVHMAVQVAHPVGAVGLGVGYVDGGWQWVQHSASAVTDASSSLDGSVPSSSPPPQHDACAPPHLSAGRTIPSPAKRAPRTPPSSAVARPPVDMPSSSRDVPLHQAQPRAQTCAPVPGSVDWVSEEATTWQHTLPANRSASDLDTVSRSSHAMVPSDEPGSVHNTCSQRCDSPAVSFDALFGDDVQSWPQSPLGRAGLANVDEHDLETPSPPSGDWPFDEVAHPFLDDTELRGSFE